MQVAQPPFTAKKVLQYWSQAESKVIVRNDFVVFVFIATAEGLVEVNQMKKCLVNDEFKPRSQADNFSIRRCFRLKIFYSFTILKIYCCC